MTGLRLAREIALLGAQSMVATATQEIGCAEEGWAVHQDRWQELAQRVHDHELKPDPLYQRLQESFHLSPLGYWLVMLCTAVEVYPEAAAAVSIVAENDQVYLITPAAFTKLMAAARGTDLFETMPEALEAGWARRSGLVVPADVVPGRPTSQQPLKLAPNEIQPLLENRVSHPAASGSMIERHPSADQPVHDETLVRLAAGLAQQHGVVCIRSDSNRAGQQLAMDLASHWKTQAVFVRAQEQLPTVATLTRVRDGLAVLDLTEYQGKLTLLTTLLADLRQLGQRVIVMVNRHTWLADIASVSAPRLGYAHGRRVWKMVVHDGDTADSLAKRFRVNLLEARCAAQRTHELLVAKNGQPTRATASDLAQQVLAQGAHRIGRLVTYLRGNAQLEDLVVPQRVRQQLEDIVAWHRYTDRVYTQMNLNGRSPLGRGLSCLFSGPPGTGKTFAALCLANTLGLNLYRIDLSQVVSKYIGETEKALSAVFDEAETGHGILFFDEADALFGKRSEVKDAHDRYANIEVGYLLQRLEAFDGVTVLASNLRSNMDPAFVRRLRFILEFPIPDEPMRRRLWEQALPSGHCRSEDLDLAWFVQRYRISGGNIHNIGLAAAHMAAAEPDCRLTTSHLVRATYRELEKMGQTRSRAEFGPLARYLPEDEP